MKWIVILIEKIRKILNVEDKKRTLQNAVIIIVVGIIAIIAGSTFFGNEKEKGKEPPKVENADVKEVVKTIDISESSDIENRVEKVLSQISGAGKVTVLITYASGKELVPATDISKTENGTEEKDNGGGSRNIDQSDYESKIAYEEQQGGGKKPIIVKEILPQVKGVVVVADGAADPQIKEDLSKAVRVLMDIPAHKIQVFERSK